MPKPNYRFQKRQKDLEKKRKREEKLQRKRDRASSRADATPGEESVPGETPLQE
ncbi:MAG TPA: hypothetical protein VFU46_10555 [Gemmatimonadales bacterium]|nr:hypothetical protein [Gemmatimonadales bacterium]